MHTIKVPAGIVSALGITQIIGYGTLYYSFSILAPGMAKDLGISLERVFAVFSVSLFIGGAQNIVSGGPSTPCRSALYNITTQKIDGAIMRHPNLGHLSAFEGFG